ncbi:hypothetical protein CIB84_012106 [Bambusicola thoracicus]|uniref:Uncharacterized protein n=1 Tax=Bambusicola thoracicus TaxID=9083 RepID=A0A2P4SJ60_BAMTH|nr:hypothetical protein CIB84_012106 [Bambusicola thoracicus]
MYDRILVRSLINANYVAVALFPQEFLSHMKRLIQELKHSAVAFAIHPSQLMAALQGTWQLT